jgi:hypothetical protein
LLLEHDVVGCDLGATQQMDEIAEHESQLCTVKQHEYIINKHNIIEKYPCA